MALLQCLGLGTISTGMPRVLRWGMRHVLVHLSQVFLHRSVDIQKVTFLSCLTPQQRR